MHSPEGNNAELDLVEAVYDALDDDDPQRALALTGQALGAGEDPDPVVLFLRGVALLELDRPGDAARVLRRAVELDADDAEFRARLAESLYRSCDFATAAGEARRALESDPDSPAALYVTGLVAERDGRWDEADRAFARAAELDPDACPLPVRLPAGDFERRLEEAIDGLPAPFRHALSDVVVAVDEVPAADLLFEERPPLEPDLLGLFVGVPRTELSTMSPGGELPPRIYLFKRNLERFALDAEDLREQIGVTLRHELGHYLGLDEDEIERTGHG